MQSNILLKTKSILATWNYFYYQLPDITYISTPFWPLYQRKYVLPLISDEEDSNIIFSMLLPEHRRYLEEAIQIQSKGSCGEDDFTIREAQDYQRNTEAAYEANAIYYKNETVDDRSLDELMDKFCKLVSNERTILDVGCGPGRDLVKFKGYGKQVIGIDASSSMLTIAQEFSSLPVLQMDMRELKFATSFIEGIWCAASLLHLHRSEVKQTLREFWRVLQSNGVLFISVKQGTGTKLVYSQKVGGMPRLFTFFSRQEIVDDLRETGFRLIEISRSLLYRENKGWDVWINVLAYKEDSNA